MMNKKRLALIFFTIIFMVTAACGKEAAFFRTKDLPWKNIFTEYGLPDYFCLLPAYKTGFDMRYSKDRCVGSWALSAPVARHYGLKIDDVRDDRLDPEIASETAARYLKDLTNIYGSYDLAALAYLNGPTLMLDAVKRFGMRIDSMSNTDIETLQKFLPYNTQCININKPKLDTLKDVYKRHDFEQITLDNPIRIKTICNSLNIEEKELVFFNPSIKRTDKWICDETIFIPKTSCDSINIKIKMLYDDEKTALNDFNTAREKEIVKAAAERGEEIKKANAVKIYWVKEGDTLSHIAKKYKVTIRQLKAWNNLHSDFLRINQKLKIKKL